MAYEFCSCPESSKEISPRDAKALRVFHSNASRAVLILVNSPSPRKWHAVVGTPAGWRLASFASTSIKSWHVVETRGRFVPPLGDGDLGILVGSMEDRGATLDVANNATSEMKRHQHLPDAADPLSSPFAGILPPSTPREAYIPRAKKVIETDVTFAPSPPNPDSYWYEAPRDAKLVNDFISLRLAGYVTNMIVVGPSGFGKTKGIIRQGALRNVPVHVVNCQAITTPEKWVGQMQVHPDRGTYFDPSQHIQWVERTHPDCEGAPYCIMLYDEISRLRADLSNMLFSLLDDQQGLEVPQMNRRVVMSDKNVVIATANIGTPYAGTFGMDWALRGRFDVNLEVPLPPADEEQKILTSASHVSEKDAAAMIRVARHTRTLWANGELESPISTRSLVSWARFVGGGYSIKDAAEYTIIPLYSEDGGEESDRAKVKQTLEGKVALA